MRLVYIKSLGKIGIKTETDFLIPVNTSVLRPNEPPRLMVASTVAVEEKFVVCPLSDIVPIYSDDEMDSINATIERLKEESERFIEEQQKAAEKQLINDVVDNIVAEGNKDDS